MDTKRKAIKQSAASLIAIIYTHVHTYEQERAHAYEHKYTDTNKYHDPDLSHQIRNVTGNN